MVGGAALATRLAAAFVLDGFHNPHVEEYDLVARNMLAGRGFAYPQHGIIYYSVIAPLPAWLSAGSYWLTGTLAPMMTLQITAGAATAMAAATVAQRLFAGPAAPLATGLLVAFHPGLTVYSASRAHSLPFDALFFTLALLQTLRIAERPGVRRAAWLGLIVGIGMLSRATIALFLPLAMLWLLVACRSWKQVISIAVVSGVCAAAAVGPWSIRNTLLHDQFILLVTTDSEVFWRGNNPHATGTSFVDENRTVLSTLSPAELQDLHRQPNELAQSEWFRIRAHSYIREYPDQFVRMALLKLFYFWWYSPSTGLLYPPLWFLLSHVIYVITMVLAGLGVWHIARRRRFAMPYVWLIAGFVATLSLFQSLYYVEGRHRWAVEPMVLALSGGGAAMCSKRFRLLEPSL